MRILGFLYLLVFSFGIHWRIAATFRIFKFFPHHVTVSLVALVLTVALIVHHQLSCHLDCLELVIMLFS